MFDALEECDVDYYNTSITVKLPRALNSPSLWIFKGESGIRELFELATIQVATSAKMIWRVAEVTMTGAEILPPVSRFTVETDSGKIAASAKNPVDTPAPSFSS